MRRAASSVCAAVLVAGLLCACARTDVHRENAPQGPHAVANPSTFPLYPRAVVITVVPMSSAQMFAAMKAADPNVDLPRNFRGHEIIAETTASMKQLDAWITGLKTTPPRGFHKVTDKDGSTSYNTTRRDVAVGANFEDAGADRSVFIIAVDPRKLHDALGPAFAVIQNYQAVPGMLRGPLDDAAKKEFGYTVSEMLDLKSPIGAALATLNRLQTGDRRAILLIDESRAK